MLQVGDVAPDLTLATVDGGSRSLIGGRQNGHTVLLVFLRHLG